MPCYNQPMPSPQNIILGIPGSGPQFNSLFPGPTPAKPAPPSPEELDRQPAPGQGFDPEAIPDPDQDDFQPDYYIEPEEEPWSWQ